MKYILLDTFALAKIAIDSNLSCKVKEYIAKNDLILVLDLLILHEIYQHQNSWADIIDFLADNKFIFAKNIDKLQDDEVINYPNEITLPCAMHSDNLGTDKIAISKALLLYLSTVHPTTAVELNHTSRSVMTDNIKEKANYPPDENGKYSSLSTWIFIISNAMREIMLRYPAFCKKNDLKKLRWNLLKSRNIVSALVFFEYYIQNKTGKNSDNGDFWHLSYLPYIQYAVLDNERYALVNRIRSDHRFRSISKDYSMDLFISCKVFNWKLFLDEINCAA